MKTRITLLGLTYLMQLADIWSTGSDVSVEWNPLMVYLWDTRVAVKMGTALFLTALYYLIAKHLPGLSKLYLASLTFCNIVMVGVVLRNIYILWLFY